MTSSIFSLIFIAVLSFTTLLQLWLKTRHIRHVAAHRNQVPAAFAAAIDLASHQRAADYTIAKARFARASLVFEALVLLAFTLGGGIAALDGVAHQMAGDGIVGGLVLIALVSVVSSAVSLPWSIWATFRLEASFGFNKTTPAVFVGDLVRSAAVGAVLGLPLAAAVLYFLQAAGGWWWLYAWLAWVAFGVGLLLIFPKYIAPLFNKFTPLESPELRGRIDALLAKCGFAANGVFVMDGSRRSSHGNAYFTGMGKTKRIVFFDTLVERLQVHEIEAVLAHELGHFAHRHVVQRLVTMYGMAFVALAIAGLLYDAAWFYHGLGVPTPSHAAFLLLLLYVLPEFSFPIGALRSRVSRKHEYEADSYAAQHASAAALQSGLVKLYQDNAATLTPDPLHSLFYDSHPPAALRIAALNQSESHHGAIA